MEIKRGVSIYGLMAHVKLEAPASIDLMSKPMHCAVCIALFVFHCSGHCATVIMTERERE